MIIAWYMVIIEALVAIYLGIDGGGTQTTCAVGDDLGVLATAVAGGSNVVRVGEHEARSNLREAVTRACEAAQVSPGSVDAAVIGIAGASVPPVKEMVCEMIRDLVPGDVDVVGDMVIAMEAAFAGLPGVVVISGTGSVAFGRNERGDAGRAGGWGHAISDEGSGLWIGRNAVSSVMHALDASEPTALLRAILDAWNLDSIEQLVQKANAAPPPDFPSLFPAVESAACAGDNAARQLLTRAGDELARLAKLVIERLWTRNKAVRVAIGGGVFAHSPLVRRTFWKQLRADCPRAAVNFKIIQPVAGALWMARRMAAGTQE
jgi:N-acetylglucosamine kinase-like BadF-type ATPase